jgi:hypothetical protein
MLTSQVVLDFGVRDPHNPSVELMRDAAFLPGSSGVSLLWCVTHAAWSASGFGVSPSARRMASSLARLTV